MCVDICVCVYVFIQDQDPDPDPGSDPELSEKSDPDPGLDPKKKHSGSTTVVLRVFRSLLTCYLESTGSIQSAI